MVSWQTSDMRLGLTWKGRSGPFGGNVHPCGHLGQDAQDLPVPSSTPREEFPLSVTGEHRIPANLLKIPLTSERPGKAPRDMTSPPVGNKFASRIPLGRRFAALSSCSRV